MEIEVEHQKLFGDRVIQVLQQFADGKSGAEHKVLECLSACVMRDFPISHDLQHAANLIIARSLCKGSLPAKRKGRPKGSGGIDAERVTERFLQMVDEGSTYESAVAELSEEFHKDDRHISRLVSGSRDLISAKRHLAGLADQFPELREPLKQMEILWQQTKLHYKNALDPDEIESKNAEWLEEIDAKIEAFTSGNRTTDI